jgi:putative endonuclease
MPYYVYIMTNNQKSLYSGVTNDQRRRVYEHKEGVVEGFTSRYKIDRLVYYEEARDARTAITREKQLKGWLRNKKLELVESKNPCWLDLELD